MGAVGVCAVLVMMYVIPSLSKIQNLEAYVLFALIITEVMIFLTNYKIENKRHFFDKREEHTRLLVENTYSKLVDVYIYYEALNLFGIGYPQNFGTYITQKLEHKPDKEPIIHVPYKTRISEPYLSWGLKHLEKYDDVYQHWKEANSLLNEFNEALPHFIEKLDDVIKKTVEGAFPDFVEDIMKPDSNYYYLENIKKLILYDLYHSTITVPKKPFFEIEKINAGNCFIQSNPFSKKLMEGQGENSIDEKKFQSCLELIYWNAAIPYTKINDKLYRAESELFQFRRKLPILIDKFHAGMMVEGVCELPY